MKCLNDLTKQISEYVLILDQCNIYLSQIKKKLKCYLLLE